MNLTNPDGSELLFVGFNQDYGCFACGTNSGFKIFNCDPFKETFSREFEKGGIGYVEMLFRCNILALVGGGKNPRYPLNKVMIWDDHQNRCIGELSFRSAVRAVKLRRDRVVVVLEYKIYVYNFADLKLVDQIDTTSNVKGLCALCPDTEHNVLVCPALERGVVRVHLYDEKKETVPSPPLSLPLSLSVCVCVFILLFSSLVPFSISYLLSGGSRIHMHTNITCNVADTGAYTPSIVFCAERRRVTPGHSFR
jgi:hypothetical protein